MSNIDVVDLKEKAAGRWPEILASLGGIPADTLDGKHHPCPKCNGTDRFRALDDFAESGALFCNQCFSERNGDGIAALVWLTGKTFSETLDMLAEYLDAKPTEQGHALDWTSTIGAGGHTGNGKPRIVATYDYRNEAGDVVFQVVRYEPKDFRQRRPKPGGGWEWSVKGVRQVPYRLLELLATPKRFVFVPEGEKDVDNLAGINLLATCNSGGSGKWTAEHAQHLHGRRVFILPDNDKAGHDHAAKVALSLIGKATSIKIIELPGLPEKGDVSDWLEAGGTRERLVELAEASSEWTPEETPTSGPILICLADVEPRSISWLWPGRIPLGRITLLVGRPGEGKSFLTTDAAARVTTGTPWPDGGDCPKGSVILISAEDDPGDTIRPRLDAHHADLRHVHLLSAVRRVDDAGHQHERMVTLADVDAIETVLKRLHDCKLIVVDPIGSFLGGKTDAHRDNEVRSVLAPIALLAEKYGPAVLVLAHRRKSVGESADDSALGSRAFTGIARAVWHLSRDPENKTRRLLLPGKNNLAKEGDGLAFAIGGEPPRLWWEDDPIAMSADQGLAVEQAAHKPGPDADAQNAAVAWLDTALAGGPRLAKELTDEWVNGEGGAKRTLERARQALGVEAYRPENPGPWLWRSSFSVLDAAEADRQAHRQDPKGKELGDLGGVPQNTENLPLF